MRLAASAFGLVLLGLGVMLSGTTNAMVLGLLLLTASPVLIHFVRRRRRPRLYLVRTNPHPILTRGPAVVTLRRVHLA